MNSVYRPDLKADLALDDNDRVRHIQHRQQRWLADSDSPLPATIDYLQSMAAVFAIPVDQLAHLSQEVSFLEPREQGTEYRLAEEKRFFDSVTYGFYQTCLNVPVWQAGLSVTLEQNPIRVVAATNNSQDDIAASLPDAAAIVRYQQLFRHAESAKHAGENPTLPVLRALLGATEPVESVRPSDRPEINRGRFYVYRYDEQCRQSLQPDHSPAGGGEEVEVHLTLPLPPVPPRIRHGQDYLVAELMFAWPDPRLGLLTWRALAEVETDAVLYLEALTAGVNGKVFTYDPVTSTGRLDNKADKDNVVFNPLRKDVVLSNLDPPIGGIQSLIGKNVQIVDLELPSVTPPAQPAGVDFDYDARTDGFSAVNAYYHADQVFTLIADLGFPLNKYFDGTSFPVPIDHRALKEINAVGAFCDQAGDGIGRLRFGLSDATDPSNPIGRAVDKWVHWHEIGGHGILMDHVGSPNFRFAHSAGDGLAALQNDPESCLRGTKYRFQYGPFINWKENFDRWFNRDVADGWAWGGQRDKLGYDREQILATSHFRIYRCLGGDASDVAHRWFASRVVTYLILRTVCKLTRGTSPSNAQLYCEALMAADLLNWTTEGLYGGAYNKVIRWAFEKQGLFQPPGTLPPVTKAGDPPDVDVYIDDGRHGEYPYKLDHWNNTSVWNRHVPDGGKTHQPAVVKTTNYAYVKVKNRGTKTASNVIVKGYHCLPGAGLTWPVDFVQMAPLAGISIATIGPSHSEEVTAGPFAWTPNPKAHGHDCLLMIASTAGDPSNVNHFTAGESVGDWRLVPHDNNIAQRNVQLVPGESNGFMQALHKCVFVAGNSFGRPAAMELRLQIPTVLSSRGWLILFRGLPTMQFTLQPGEKREILLDVGRGRRFTREDVALATDRDVSVLLYGNGILLGGMIYRLDPELA